MKFGNALPFLFLVSVLYAFLSCQNIDFRWGSVGSCLNFLAISLNVRFCSLHSSSNHEFCGNEFF